MPITIEVPAPSQASFDECYAELDTLIASHAELLTAHAALTARVAKLEPPIVLSKPWTTIPPASEIITVDGRITVVNGVVMRDGVPLGHSDHVVACFNDLAGRVWQQSSVTGAICWSWNATTWVSGPDPRAPVIPPTNTPRARMIAYLRSIAGKQCLIGQMSNDGGKEFADDVAALGFSPAIMFQDPWAAQWAGNAPFWANFMPSAMAHVKSGGIFGMSLMLPNPVNLGPSMNGPAVDPVLLLTPGSALNGALNRMLDQAAGLLQQFKDAGHAVLTRFLLELDGGWFWWGDGHFSNAQQTQLYRYIVNYLRVTRQLDNLLTTFAINGGPGDYEFPGVDVVDIVGIDAYTNNLAGYKAVCDKLIAQAPDLVFALTEFGSGTPVLVNAAYNVAQIKIDIKAAFPRAVYIDFWSGWGPNQMVNAKAALSDPFWINKSQVQVP